MNLDKDGIGYNECIPLCLDCYNIFYHRTDESVHNTENWKYMWASYLWRVFCSLANYGDQSTFELFWTVIPIGWRGWWLEEVKALVPNLTMQLTLNFPKAEVDDISSIYDEHMKMRKEKTLRGISFTVKQYPYPMVLCPWGCTEFVERCGTIPIDAIFQHLFDYVTMPVTVKGSNQVKLCRSCRRDYLHMRWTNSVGKWKPRPCYVFHPNKGLVFLTCQDHEGGTRDRYLHVPTTVLPFPAKVPDQLSHCVVQPRMVKKIQLKGYNTIYQMVGQMGGFEGIDSCMISAHGYFDIASVILEYKQAQSSIGRSDIELLLNTLKERGYIDTHYKDMLHENAAILFPKKEQYKQSCTEGSTFIKFDDCIRLSKVMASEILVCIEIPGATSAKFPPCWTYPLIYVHDCNEHGARPPDIGSFNKKSRNSGRDLSLTWYLMACCCCVTDLWNILAEPTATKFSSDWWGWFLTYLSSNVISFHRRKRASQVDPFKKAKAQSFSGTQLADVLMTYLDSKGHQYTKVCSGIKGGYNNTVVASVFDQIAGLQYMKETDFIGETNAANVRDDIDLIIVTNESPHCDSFRKGIFSELCGVSNSDRDHFELRFVAMRSGNIDSCECICYCRHGHTFQGWWKLSCKEIIRLNNIDKRSENKIVIGDWWFGIYCRRSDRHVAQLHRDYYKCIGGVNHLRCFEHDCLLVERFIKFENPNPNCFCQGLVAAENPTMRSIKSGNCQKKIEYGCPKCNLRCCKNCVDFFDVI